MATKTKYRKGNRIIEFEEEGVSFILPQELDDYYVRREDITIKPGEGYPYRRDVIQVSLLKIGWCKWRKKNFDAKLTLRVYYDDRDVARAIAEDHTQPFILIHDDNNWHIPAAQKVNHVPITGHAKWVGYMDATIDAWDDPLIGVGP